MSRPNNKQRVRIGPKNQVSFQNNSSNYYGQTIPTRVSNFRPSLNQHGGSLLTASDKLESSNGHCLVQESNSVKMSNCTGDNINWDKHSTIPNAIERKSSDGQGLNQCLYAKEDYNPFSSEKKAELAVGSCIDNEAYKWEYDLDTQTYKNPQTKMCLGSFPKIGSSYNKPMLTEDACKAVPFDPMGIVYNKFSRLSGYPLKDDGASCDSDEKCKSGDCVSGKCAADPTNYAAVRAEGNRLQSLTNDMCFYQNGNNVSWGCDKDEATWTHDESKIVNKKTKDCLYIDTPFSGPRILKVGPCQNTNTFKWDYNGHNKTYKNLQYNECLTYNKVLPQNTCFDSTGAINKEAKFNHIPGFPLKEIGEDCLGPGACVTNSCIDGKCAKVPTGGSCTTHSMCTSADYCENTPEGKKCINKLRFNDACANNISCCCHAKCVDGKCSRGAPNQNCNTENPCTYGQCQNDACYCKTTPGGKKCTKKSIVRGPCTADLHCLDNMQCKKTPSTRSFNAKWDNRCLRKNGQQCVVNEAHCLPGLLCKDNKCRKLNVGERCTSIGYCKTGLICVGDPKKCSDKKEGSNCNTNAHCDSTKGLICKNGICGLPGKAPAVDCCLQNPASKLLGTEKCEDLYLNPDKTGANYTVMNMNPNCKTLLANPADCCVTDGSSNVVNGKFCHPDTLNANKCRTMVKPPSMATISGCYNSSSNTADCTHPRFGNLKNKTNKFYDAVQKCCDPAVQQASPSGIIQTTNFGTFDCNSLGNITGEDSICKSGLFNSFAAQATAILEDRKIRQRQDIEQALTSNNIQTIKDAINTVNTSTILSADYKTSKSTELTTALKDVCMAQNYPIEYSECQTYKPATESAESTESTTPASIFSSFFQPDTESTESTKSTESTESETDWPMIIGLIIGGLISCGCLILLAFFLIGGKSEGSAGSTGSTGLSKIGTIRAGASSLRQSAKSRFR